MNLNDRKIRIAYAGLDIETLLLLCNTDYLDVVCIAQINEFFLFTFNPINWIFKLLYYFRTTNEFRLCEIIFLHIWKFTNILASGPYSNYKNLIYTLSRHAVEVVDFANKHSAKEYLSGHSIDILVVSIWEILPHEIISATKHGTINIHPSKLPQYRGSLPTLWTLKNHDKVSAVTYIILNEKMDTGDVLYQEDFAVYEKDDWFSIESKIHNIISKSLVKKLVEYKNNRATPSKQNLLLSSKTAKYEDYKFVDLLNEVSQDIFNKVNLYNYLDYWALCYFYVSNKKIYLKKINYCNASNKQNLICPGDIIISGLNVLMMSKNGILESKLFKDISWKESIFLLFYSLMSKTK